MKIRSWWCLSACLFAFAFTPGRAEASPRPAPKFSTGKLVKPAALPVPEKKEITADAKPALPPQPQALHDWQVRDRWANLNVPPGARGDPFDLAAFGSSTSVIFPAAAPVQAPVITPTDAKISAALPPDKKTFSHRAQLAYSPHHLYLQKNQDDEIPDVTILSPMPAADSEDTKAEPEDSSLTIPPPSKVEDNTNDIEMPGLTAAQSLQSQEKQNAAAVISPSPSATTSSTPPAAKSALIDSSLNPPVVLPAPIPPENSTAKP